MHASEPTGASPGKHRPARPRRRILRALLALSGLAIAGLGFVSCAIIPPRANSITLAQRLDAVQLTHPSLHAPVTIRWDDHAVPFIQAQDDRDVPYALGVVHAHLRLAQMELFRRAAQGRLAESAGPIPIVVDIDHALRLINFPRGAKASAAAMRPDTRAWVQRYVEGINAYKQSMDSRPADMRLLGIANDEPWTVEDVLTVGRLASTDINWAFLFNLISKRDDPAWQKFLPRFREWESRALPSFGADPADPATPIAAMNRLTTLLGHVSKSGSNTIVVSGPHRLASQEPRIDGPTASAAIIASDPHVGFSLPSLWMIAGYRSPSQAALGLMIPGIPAVLLGRNDAIAWGGTNMIGLSTSVFDASGVAPEAITTRRETIARRFWLPTTRDIRETPLGPLATDLALFKDWKGPPLAFRWRGHDASDELSAFLDVSRATTWDEFRAAFAPYAVSGQNFLYADTQGNIGQLLALEADPARGTVALLDPPIADPDNPRHQWSSPLRSTDLPASLNPPEGYLISANNTPVRTDPPITTFTNNNDRVARFRELLATMPSYDVDALRRLQLDVYSIASHALAKSLASRRDAIRAAASPPLSPGALALLDDIASWDGQYSVNSRGAAALAMVTHELVLLHYTTVYSKDVADFLLGFSGVYDMVREDLDAAFTAPASPTPPIVAHVPAALESSARKLPAGVTWGDRHQIQLSHWLGNVPLLGSQYRWESFGVPGNLTTIMKAAADLSDAPTTARYGADARHISDLRDPDANYFIIMGGNDGWLGSQQFMDQVQTWRDGQLIRVPFSPSGIESHFRRMMTLSPAR